MGLLRQALARSSFRPTRCWLAFPCFMTFLVMRPTWQSVNKDALSSIYGGNNRSANGAQQRPGPRREFMINQIRKAGNDEDVYLFTDFAGENPRTGATSARSH